MMITITLKSVGILKDYFGREPVSLTLEYNATLHDLLKIIDSRWGKILPNYMWNAKEQHFCGPIYIVINNKIIKDSTFKLANESEINLIKALTGGSRSTMKSKTCF